MELDKLQRIMGEYELKPTTATMQLVLANLANQHGQRIGTKGKSGASLVPLRAALS